MGAAASSSGRITLHPEHPLITALAGLVDQARAGVPIHHEDPAWHVLLRLNPLYIPEPPVEQVWNNLVLPLLRTNKETGNLRNLVLFLVKTVNDHTASCYRMYSAANPSYSSTTLETSLSGTPSEKLLQQKGEWRGEVDGNDVIQLAVAAYICRLVIQAMCAKMTVTQILYHLEYAKVQVQDLKSNHTASRAEGNDSDNDLLCKSHAFVEYEREEYDGPGAFYLNISYRGKGVTTPSPKTAVELHEKVMAFLFKSFPLDAAAVASRGFLFVLRECRASYEEELILSAQDLIDPGRISAVLQNVSLEGGMPSVEGYKGDALNQDRGLDAALQLHATRHHNHICSDGSTSVHRAENSPGSGTHAVKLDPFFNGKAEGHTAVYSINREGDGDAEANASYPTGSLTVKAISSDCTEETRDLPEPVSPASRMGGRSVATLPSLYVDLLPLWVPHDLESGSLTGTKGRHRSAIVLLFDSVINFVTHTQSPLFYSEKILEAHQNLMEMLISLSSLVCPHQLLSSCYSLDVAAHDYAQASIPQKEECTNSLSRRRLYYGEMSISPVKNTERSGQKILCMGESELTPENPTEHKSEDVCSMCLFWKHVSDCNLGRSSFSATTPSMNAREAMYAPLLFLYQQQRQLHPQVFVPTSSCASSSMPICLFIDILMTLWEGLPTNRLQATGNCCHVLLPRTSSQWLAPEWASIPAGVKQANPSVQNVTSARVIVTLTIQSSRHFYFEQSLVA